MITEQILTTADRLPGKVAINHNGTEITYRDFAAALRQATSYFARLGFCGDGIAVIADEGLDAFWVWSLALRRLGLTTASVCTPRDLKDLRLTNARFAFVRAGEDRFGLARYCLENGIVLHEVDMSHEPVVKSDATPSYEPGGQILLTSGTTGTYKKIMIHPTSEDIYSGERAGLLGLSEDSVANVFSMLPSTGLGYKVPVNVWAKGGCVIFGQQGAFHSSLSVPGATAALLTPRLLDDVLAAPESAFPRQETMKLIVTGGSISRFQLIEATRRITPLIFNMLATTEIGIIAFSAYHEATDNRWHRPIPGSVVQVVDDDDRPLTPGVIGRLRVANPAHARYFEEDAANREFFRGGFFYPGDLAELANDGRIALHGRTTDVINIRGSKVSSALVEELLSAEFNGKEFCLLTHHDSAGEERLFCVAESATPLDEQQISSLIEREVRVFNPVISYVAALPRTANGKVKRHALRESLAN